MISHRFWQRTFGGATDVSTRTLRLNGRTFAIVGVMPRGFFGLDPAVSPDIVAPNGAVEVAAATRNPLQNRGLWNPCRVVARLAPGRTDEEARIDLERVRAASIAAAPPPEPYDPPRVWLLPAIYGLSTLRDGTATPLFVLLVVVGGLLLAACANIAGLLLARGSARSRELFLRGERLLSTNRLAGPQRIQRPVPAWVRLRRHRETTRALAGGGASPFHHSDESSAQNAVRAKLPVSNFARP